MKVEEAYINGTRYIKTTPEEGYELHKVGTDEIYEEAYDLKQQDYSEVAIINEEVTEINE